MTSMDLMSFFKQKTSEQLTESIAQIDNILDSFKKSEVDPNLLLTLTSFLQGKDNLSSELSAELLETCVKLVTCILYKELCEKEVFRRQMEET